MEDSVLMEVDWLDVALVIELVVQLRVLGVIGFVIMLGVFVAVVTIIVGVRVTALVVSMLIGSLVHDMLTAILRSDGVEDGVLMEVHGFHIALVIELVVQFRVLSVVGVVMTITIVVIFMVGLSLII